MAKKKDEEFSIELHDKTGICDVHDEDFGTYAEALKTAKVLEWLDGGRDHFALITKKTIVARVERPSPVVTKL